MNCPRHQSTLVEKTINDHEVDQCPDCSGLWVPKSAIDKLLGPGEYLKLRSMCSVLDSSLRCPSDGCTLHQGKIGPVTLDLCQDCGGLWLDPGEMETLRQRKSVKPYQPQASDLDVTHPFSSPSAMILLSLMSLG